jgi:hypothetical protein
MAEKNKRDLDDVYDQHHAEVKVLKDELKDSKDKLEHALNTCARLTQFLVSFHGNEPLLMAACAPMAKKQKVDNDKKDG